MSGTLSPGPRAVPDFTDRYNTPLSPEQQLGFQQWLQLQSALNRRNMAGDTYDYDLQGAFAGGTAQAGNGHWPDTFKKPNHPSFSDQSRYHGAEGQQGGSWQQAPGGGWSFTPGPTNLQLHGAQGLQEYFQRSDPGVQLQLPQAQPQTMLDYVRARMG